MKEDGRAMLPVRNNENNIPKFEYLIDLEFSNFKFQIRFTCDNIK